MLQNRPAAAGLALISLLVTCGLLGGACGHDAAGAGGAGTTGAGGVDCANVYTPDDDCGTCLHEKCCAELAACGATDYCVACLVGSVRIPVAECYSTNPDFTTPFNAIANCSFDRCAQDCWRCQLVCDGGDSDGGDE